MDFARRSASLPTVNTTIAALSSAPAFAAAPGVASNGTRRSVKFRDGVVAPALGQGTGGLAQGRRPQAVEEEALRTGLSLGMTLIDTAEIYGNGRSEKLIGQVIASQRDGVFLVSKVWPNHVTGNGIARACEASLAVWHHRSFLHGHRGPNLAGVVPTSKVCTGGKIRAWACQLQGRRHGRPFPCYTVIAARPIRFFTTLAAATLSRICCHGASNMPCR
jgi:hypothetical protein